MAADAKPNDVKPSHWSASVVTAALSAFARWGAALLGPRRYAASASPTVGQRDALMLGTLYVLGTSLYPLADAAATVWATRNLSGGLMFAAAFGRAVLAPVIVLVAVETVLGRGRGHQRALGLLPLVVLATAAHALRQLGIDTGLPALAVDVAGGVLGVGLALWIRPVVAAWPQEVNHAE